MFADSLFDGDDIPSDSIEESVALLTTRKVFEIWPAPGDQTGDGVRGCPFDQRQVFQEQLSASATHHTIRFACMISGVDNRLVHGSVDRGVYRWICG